MGGLRFCVLGWMRATRGDAPLQLGSPQQQAVLAALLLRPGHVVSTDDLIDALWREQPPSQARATVRTYVWRLRKTLELAPGEPSVLTSLSHGYRLVLPDGAVDVLQAEALAAGAQRARSDGDPERARGLLAEALTLWQGEPLAGVPGAFAERQRHRLTEFRMTLLQDRIGLDVELGNAAGCVPELSELVTQYPLREGLYGLLMQSLAQVGRQAEALEVYRRVRTLLVDELGVEPGPELLALHRRVLDGDAGLAGPPASARPVPAPTPDAAPAAVPAPAAEQSEGGPAGGPGVGSAVLGVAPLPAQLPPGEPYFTGRSAVVAELCEALSAAPGSVPRIASVAGMGGVGKTTLALHVAHQLKRSFVDGQLYADLRGYNDATADPETVVSGFLQALGVSIESMPDGLAARAALFRSMIEGRRLLILLDNVRDGAQIRPLLPGTGECAVLVTSRVWLAGVPTVIQVGLDVFEPAEALGLLEQVIGAQRVADERDVALDLVTTCGFLPIAVRIVSARLAARPSWTVRTLVGRLADERRRIDELRAGDLAVYATFELGYRQLNLSQAEAFRRVAAVDGPDISLSSAAALVGIDEYAADELLESLADVAMLESLGGNRYRHHDLLRSFAGRRSEMDHPQEAVAARARLLDHLLASACAAFECAVPGDPIRSTLAASGPPTSAPGLEFRDLAAAREWVRGETEGAMRLVVRIARDAVDRDATDRDAVDRDATDRGGAGDGTAALRTAVNLLIALSPFGFAPRQNLWAETARALAEAAALAGDRFAEGRARFLQGNIATAAAWLDEAEQYTRQAVRICREVGDRGILQQSLNDLGLLTQFRGRYEEAVGHYDEATALARQLGSRASETATVLNSAAARVRGGLAAEGAEAAEAVLLDLRERRDDGGAAQALYVLGLALHALRRHAEAADRFAESLALWTSLGPPGREAPARYRLADSLRELGRLEQALAHAELALRACEQNRSELDQGHALMVLVRVLTALGRRCEARPFAERARAVLGRLGLPDAELAEQHLRPEDEPCPAQRRS